jgi:hypothetical protein
MIIPKIIFLTLILSLSGALMMSCARDKKYFREDTGVLTAQSRSHSGVNTGTLKK